jgi:NAD(P)-dependent dehydrogenase (short-subunit alcohol dehydrogenase family)
MNNALVIGCGSKFGHAVFTELAQRGMTVYGISGSTESSNVLKVNWNTCFINDFEKFLRQLPSLDVVIFNQNSPALTERYWQLDSVPVFEIWRQSKQWQQSFYVNCIMPGHVIHTLAGTKKLTDQSRVAWMLSRGMLTPSVHTIDYFGQKRQNYDNMQQFARHNSQTFVGVCPGPLESATYQSKSTQLVDLLTQPDIESGKLYTL